MKPLNVVIIDDEPNAVKVIERLISTYFSDKMEVVSSFTDPDEAEMKLDKLKPDLVFLDINMGERTGFDLLKSLSNRSFHLVFITAYDDFAVQAFRENALDYLLKPVDPELFREAVEKVMARQRTHNNIKALAFLENLMMPPRQIGLPSKDGYHMVDANQILFAKASGSYCIVQTLDGEQFVLSRNLKAVEQLLDNRNFLRVNRSAIVNLHFLVGFSRSQGGSVSLSGGHEFGISATLKAEVLKRIQEDSTLL